MSLFTKVRFVKTQLDIEKFALPEPFRARFINEDEANLIFANVLFVRVKTPVLAAQKQNIFLRS